MMMVLRTNVARWSAWHVQSAKRRIVTASVTVAGLTALVKLAGAAKFIAVAHRFGTADALDAFLIAFLPPAFLAEVIGSSLSLALLPTLIEVRERQGLAAARTLVSRTLWIGAALLGCAAVLLSAGGGFAVRLLGSGFEAGKLAVCESLLTTMAPLVVLMGLSAIWRGVLNAGERFALAAGVGCLTPLVTIALLWMLGRGFGAQVLAAGALLGAGIELTIVAWAAKRQGYAVWPRRPGWNRALRQVMNQYAPMMAGALLTSGAMLIDPAMAATLGRGSVSALNYGSKVAGVILAVGPVALATVALPHFSRMVALEEWDWVRRTLRTYSGWIFAATVAATLLLVGYSEPLVRLLFEKGAFTRADTSLVAGVQRCALLQLPFAMLSAPMARLVSSLKANRFLMWAAAINLVVNAGLDWLLMRRWGVVGIAFSSAMVALVSFCFLAAGLRKLLKARSEM